MVFKFLCTIVGKYCKLPLGMQRPKMNNELSKGRYATCKGRMHVCDVIWIHAYNVVSQLIAYQYIATYIVIFNSLTKIIYVMTLSWF